MATISDPADPSDHTRNVNYQDSSEQHASDLQVAWNEAMTKGNHKRPSSHSKVSVLTLNWIEKDDDLKVQSEVDGLAKVFIEKFNYSVTQENLSYARAPVVQHQLNASIANFVMANDGPNNLLIVYYAGHAEPGEDHGSIQMFG